MQRIIYKTSDGGVAIIVPADTIEACMKDIPNGVDFAVVDETDIPTDRTFRDAWEYTA